MKKRSQSKLDTKPPASRIGEGRRSRMNVGRMAHEALTGLQPSDVESVELEGFSFSTLQSRDATPPPELGPFASKDARVIKEVLNALRQDRKQVVEYSGSGDVLRLHLKHRSTIPRRILEFWVQPLNPDYDGPALRKALVSYGRVLSSDVARQARSAQQEGVKAIALQVDAGLTPLSLINEPPRITAIMQSLQHLSENAFDWFRPSQQVFIYLLRDQKNIKVPPRRIVRLRVPLQNLEGKPYWARPSAAVPSPLPRPLWDEVYRYTFGEGIDEGTGTKP